jgi:hypothetical protein
MLLRGPKVFGQSWEFEQTWKYLWEAAKFSEGQVWVDRRNQAAKSNTRFSFRIRKERNMIVISGRDHFTWCSHTLAS